MSDGDEEDTDETQNALDFRLLASRFSGDTLTCILLFTSNRIPLDCISGQ